MAHSSDDEYSGSDSDVADSQFYERAVRAASSMMSEIRDGEHIGRRVVDIVAEARRDRGHSDSTLLNPIFEVVSAILDSDKRSQDEILQFVSVLTLGAQDNAGTEYSEVGEAFAVPGFRSEVEIRKVDVELQEVGPARKQGFVACIRCGSMNTETMEKQTRSADEGMTEFNVCFQCNKRWRVNA